MENNTGTPKDIALRMLEALQIGSEVAKSLVETAEKMVSEGKYQDLIDLHNSIRSVRALHEIGVSSARIWHSRFSCTSRYDDLWD